MAQASQLEAQGSLPEALEAYVRDRQWAAAGRLALKLGRPLEAAAHYLNAQQPYEAAVCYQKGGAAQECLEALLQVPATEPRYRAACVHAIRVALSLGEPIERLQPFIVPFVNSAPATPAEAAAMDQLAQIFAAREAWQMAARIYARVLEAFPDDAEALAGRARISQSAASPTTPRETSSPKVAVREITNPKITVAPPEEPQTPGPARTMTGRNAAVRPGGPKKSLGETLIARGALTPEKLQRILASQPETRASERLLGEALVANGLVTELDVVRALAEVSSIPYISEARLLQTATADAPKLLSAEHAERHIVVPIAVIQKQLYVAMRDPRDYDLIDKLRFVSGKIKVNGVFATEGSIRKAIRKLYYGEEVFEDSADQWRGKLFEPGGEGMLQPFSDRVTGTREREFDTTELERKAMRDAIEQQLQGAAPQPAPASPGTSAVPITQEVHRPAPMQMPDVGQVFAERYKIEARLGEGGSATVFQVVDLELGEPVAIKLYRPSLQTDALLARFKLELSLSRQLAHPNVVRLFDLGSYQGWRYLTMELLLGSDLSTKISGGRGLPVKDGIDYLVQACRGLQAAHDRGVIHRDVKPQNLFITEEGVVKVMDFGIAKRERMPGVTVEGTMIGTPEYMSPEQIDGIAEVTHLTDLYSLGVTAYAVFTGAPPFEDPKMMKILKAHVDTTPVPPRQKRPELPVELEAVILKLLAKKPEERFQTCNEVASALQGIAT